MLLGAAAGLYTLSAYQAMLQLAAPMLLVRPMGWLIGRAEGLMGVATEAGADGSISGLARASSEKLREQEEGEVSAEEVDSAEHKAGEVEGESERTSSLGRDGDRSPQLVAAGKPRTRAAAAAGSGAGAAGAPPPGAIQLRRRARSENFN